MSTKQISSPPPIPPIQGNWEQSYQSLAMWAQRCLVDIHRELDYVHTGLSYAWPVDEAIPQDESGPITPSATGTTYSNEGASAFTAQFLPKAVVGLRYAFIKVANYGMAIVPRGERFRSSTAYMSLLMGSVGSYVGIACLETGIWDIIIQTGETPTYKGYMFHENGGLALNEDGTPIEQG